jgi:hypothetical protein
MNETANDQRFFLAATLFTSAERIRTASKFRNTFSIEVPVSETQNIEKQFKPKHTNGSRPSPVQTQAAPTALNESTTRTAKTTVVKMIPLVRH